MGQQKYIWMICACIMLSVACERSKDWPIDAVDDRRLVVEAILTDENRTQEINLATSFQQLNEEEASILQADVRVDANGTIYLFEPDVTNPGRFVSIDEFSVIPNLKYTLRIIWNGIEYNAQSELSEVAPMPEINFTSYRTDSFRLDDNVVPLFSSNQQAMYQFDIDWKHLFPEADSEARIFYYTFSTVHNSEFVRPESEVVPFPRGSKVVLIKYGLDDGFGDYIRSLAIETDWNGLFLYGNPENLPTNLSGDALGYFATCAILRDTLIAN